MITADVIIIGGGAAGFFAAIACAEARPGIRISILEKGTTFLSKVLISGGGRCNVTHACFDPRELSLRYPRGGKELIGPFHRFQPRDTMSWFESRGVQLKIENDGRIFPASNSSHTIRDCLLDASDAAGITRRLNCRAKQILRLPDKQFQVILADDSAMICRRLLLATGGCRTAAAGSLAVSLEHTLEIPVPSLFGFDLQPPALSELAGITVPQVSVSIPEAKIREEGPLLITHRGVSGPAILRLSAWGARALHARNYQFSLCLNWLPRCDQAGIAEEMQRCRRDQAARRIIRTPLFGMPGRLWQWLVHRSGIESETQWAALDRSRQHQLILQLCRTELKVIGKSMNKEEFVTCGGVRLSEVDFKSMQSRICPGLYFAGELLDIDGLTGGFNFQAAWTTGWIAGHAMSHYVSM